jgi:biopolymer transport protein TolR
VAMDLGGSRGVRSEINVTPLVDVVLVLLIIFMVITPLLQRGKSVDLPESTQLSRLNEGGDPVFLSVTKDGRLYIDKAEVPRAELAQAVRAELLKSPHAPVLLRADREVDYRVVRAVVAELSRASVSGVSLAGSESSGGR